MPDHDRISADLDHYAGLGIKASGGTGDTAGGDWLAAELMPLGFVIERQSISVPFFTIDAARVEAGDAQAEVVAWLVTNGPTGRAIALNADGRQPMFSGPVAAREDNRDCLLPEATAAALQSFKTFVAGALT